jgi:hypothetical protein
MGCDCAAERDRAALIGCLQWLLLQFDFKSEVSDFKAAIPTRNPHSAIRNPDPPLLPHPMTIQYPPLMANDAHPGDDRASKLPAPLIAVAGWLVPGAGYWLIGERARAAIAGVTIVALFILGLLVAGVRVIEVPGYDSQTGQQIRMMRGRRVAYTERLAYESAGWALTNGGLLAEVLSKPWYVGQVLAGPLCLLSSAASVRTAQRSFELSRSASDGAVIFSTRPHAPLEAVGVLYTAVAGMLNLLIMIDAAYRAGLPRAAQVSPDARPEIA